jgi:hypothetical protein
MEFWPLQSEASYSRHVAARLRRHAPGSREEFRELVKIGVELAVESARWQLAMKTRQAMSNAPPTTRNEVPDRLRASRRRPPRSAGISRRGANDPRQLCLHLASGGR